jgi:basic membrane protein A and related proteins
MGHSGLFVSAMEQVAPDFPKAQFIAVSDNEGKPPSVISIDWNNAQFGCQRGLLAAQMSKSHKMGGVYGLQGIPISTAQAGGFRICATKVGAQVTILHIKDEAAASCNTATAPVRRHSSSEACASVSERVLVALGLDQYLREPRSASTARHR